MRTVPIFQPQGASHEKNPPTAEKEAPGTVVHVPPHLKLGQRNRWGPPTSKWQTDLPLDIQLEIYKYLGPASQRLLGSCCITFYETYKRFHYTKDIVVRFEEAFESSSDNKKGRRVIGTEIYKNFLTKWLSPKRWLVISNKDRRKWLKVSLIEIDDAIREKKKKMLENEIKVEEGEKKMMRIKFKFPCSLASSRDAPKAVLETELMVYPGMKSTGWYHWDPELEHPEWYSYGLIHA